MVARQPVSAGEGRGRGALNLSPDELMNLQAESSPPGANGLLFLPYLLGERSPVLEPQGVLRVLSGVSTMKHNRADMIRGPGWRGSRSTCG